eukprot:scaffold18741_cov89-Skeletonema_dohrnii-CCMP3373.AAC.1
MDMDGRLSSNDAAAGGIGIGSSGEVVNHVFGQIHDEDDGGGKGDDEDSDSDRICLTLLYRPGHYDILY